MKYIVPLLACCLLGNTLKFETVMELEPVSDDSEYFLQTPASVDIGPDGSIYIADWFANVLFKWDGEGNYVETIGTPGPGPGEFAFNQNFGGPQGYVGVTEDAIFVYDGGKRSISIFDTTGTYQRSMVPEVAVGRTNSVFVTPEKHIIIYQQSFIKETPTRDVVIFDQDGKLVKKVISIEDNSFRREGEGNRRQIVFKAYSPVLNISYNRAQSELMVGEATSPSFKVIELESGEERTIRVGLTQRELTEEDKFEIEELPFIKRSSFFKAEYPEKKAFYARIVAVADEGFLVFSESPFYHRLEGIYVDRSGKTLSRLNHRCGENGSIHGIAGRLLLVETDEDGEFSIREIKI